MPLSKNQKISDSMKGNTNAEVWTYELAEKLFLDAIKLSNNKKMFTVFGKEIQGYEFDFIGEIARELDSYIDVFDYLVGKFSQLKNLKTKLMRNCEANCFSNSKKGIIKEASAIMNLKANHKWTDRIDSTSLGEKLNTVNLNEKSTDELEKRYTYSIELEKKKHEE